jgi:Spy/CpxP family protein refolding chaperone
MNLRRSILAAILGLASLAGASASAQMGPPPPPGEGPGGPGGPPGPGGPGDALHPLMMLLRNASLTPAQQDQVHQLMSAHRSQVEPLFDKLHTALDQIADKLIGSPDVVSSQDLAPLRQQASQIQEAIDQANLETAVQIRGLLTADQRSHLADIHRQVKSLHDQLDALLHPPGGSFFPPPPR